MKRYIKINFVLFISILLISNGCTDLLTEKPQSQIVPSFFSSADGVVGGIAGVYNDIRNSWGTEGFYINQVAGTDEYRQGDSASPGEVQAFTYGGLTSTSTTGGFGFYTDINTLNGVLLYAPNAKPTPTNSAAVLQSTIGQAYFLRAFLYFQLVQTYGSIPLHSTFNTTPTFTDSKAPVADIYALIVDDLTQAIANLPAKPTAPYLGKAATIAAAKWLLAKVYLTRGWLNNDNGDFNLAYNTANDLITNASATYGLGLWQDYADVFKPANDYGKETIFVSDHSSDTKYGAYAAGSAGGNGINVAPWLGLANLVSNVHVNAVLSGGVITAGGGPALVNRDIQFGRPFTRIMPNIPKVTGTGAGAMTGKSYIYDQAFVNRNNDSRYSKTFQTLWLENASDALNGQSTPSGVYSGAGVTGSRGQLVAGLDTAIWFPDYEVPGAPQAFGARPFKGIIINPSAVTTHAYPYMKKWADPSRVNQNDPSTRPFVIARLGEVYLIAAEAAFKAGNKTNAAAMLNVIRQRAAFRSGAPYTPGGAFGTSLPTTMNGDPYPAGVTYATAVAAMTIADTDVTLDFILDERTRELYGEAPRWLDLVRTQSLLSRVAAWNPIEAGTKIQPFHVLRPLPSDELSLVPDMAQNPGY